MFKKSLLLAMALSGLACSSSAHADNILAVVSDTVLDSMRGRFIDANQITYFGIQMISSWRTPDGSISGNAAVLHGTLQSPQLTAYRYGNGNATPVVDSTVPTGLQSVEGVVQINQISGEYNQTANSTNIVIGGPGQLNPANPGIGWVATSIGHGVETGNGKLRVEVAQGSAGTILQEIGRGQVLQFSRINSSGIMSANSLSLKLELNPNKISTAQLVQAQQSLLRGR